MNAGKNKIEASAQLMPGKFKKGAVVRLRRPSEHRASFDNPRGLLEIVSVSWFRNGEPPTYALCEPGGIAVTPFRDTDLMRARKGVLPAERPANLPSSFDSWNPALRGAYMKGRRAFSEGKELADCPYRDNRKPSGGLSWSRAFIRAWQDGFRDEQRDAAKGDEVNQKIEACNG